MTQSADINAGITYIYVYTNVSCTGVWSRQTTGGLDATAHNRCYYSTLSLAGVEIRASLETATQWLALLTYKLYTSVT